MITTATELRHTIDVAHNRSLQNALRRVAIVLSEKKLSTGRTKLEAGRTLFDESIGESTVLTGFSAMTDLGNCGGGHGEAWVKTKQKITRAPNGYPVDESSEGRASDKVSVKKVAYEDLLEIIQARFILSGQTEEDFTSKVLPHFTHTKNRYYIVLNPPTPEQQRSASTVHVRTYADDEYFTPYTGGPLLDETAKRFQGVVLGGPYVVFEQTQYGPATERTEAVGSARPTWALQKINNVPYSTKPYYGETWSGPSTTNMRSPEPVLLEHPSKDRQPLYNRVGRYYSTGLAEADIEREIKLIDKHGRELRYTDEVAVAGEQKDLYNFSYRPHSARNYDDAPEHIMFFRDGWVQSGLTPVGELKWCFGTSLLASGEKSLFMPLSDVNNWLEKQTRSTLEKVRETNSWGDAWALGYRNYHLEFTKRKDRRSEQRYTDCYKPNGIKILERRFRPLVVVGNPTFLVVNKEGVTGFLRKDMVKYAVPAKGTPQFDNRTNKTLGVVLESLPIINVGAIIGTNVGNLPVREAKRVFHIRQNPGETQWFPRDPKKLTFCGEGINRTSVRVVPLHNEAKLPTKPSGEGEVAFVKGDERVELIFGPGHKSLNDVDLPDGFSWQWCKEDVLPCERNPYARPMVDILAKETKKEVNIGVLHSLESNIPSSKLERFKASFAGDISNLTTPNHPLRIKKGDWVIRTKGGKQATISENGTIRNGKHTKEGILVKDLSWTAALTHCNLAYRDFKTRANESKDSKTWEANITKAHDWFYLATVCELAGGTIAPNFEIEPKNSRDSFGTTDMVSYQNEGSLDWFRSNYTSEETGDDYGDAARGSMYDPFFAKGSTLESPQEVFEDEPLSVGTPAPEEYEQGYFDAPKPSTTDGEDLLEVAEQQEQSEEEGGQQGCPEE